MTHDTPESLSELRLIRPEAEVDAARAAYAEKGRAQIHDLFDPSFAEMIRETLVRDTPWELAYNDGEDNHTLSRDEVLRLSTEKRAELQNGAFQRARRGWFQFFNYRYSMIPKYLEGADPSLRLHAVTEYLNAPEFIDLARRVTGIDEIKKADCHASLFAPGHFLTVHQDRNPGQPRRAAYTLSFTKNWRPDWGGLLLFHDNEGGVTEAWTPRFNTFSVFKVPVDHSVSGVAPFAHEGRFTIAGWFLDG